MDDPLFAQLGKVVPHAVKRDSQFFRKLPSSELRIGSEQQQQHPITRPVGHFLGSRIGFLGSASRFLGSFLPRTPVQMQIAIPQFVPRAIQQVFEEPLQIDHFWRYAPRYVLVIGAYERVAEVPGVILKRLAAHFVAHGA